MNIGGLMQKHILIFLFLLSCSLCAQAEHVCEEWVTQTRFNEEKSITCRSWREFKDPTALPPAANPAPSASKKQSSAAETSQPLSSANEQGSPYTCKIWKTAVLKNGSRQSACAEWMYPNEPDDHRIVCREFISELLSETLVKKQKRAWTSECSNWEEEKNGKFCLLWKHEYRPDGTIISRCSHYQLEPDAELPISQWTDYIGPDSDLKPVASVADRVALDKQYPCQEYTGEKMDKKRGSYKVTCTRYATEAPLPAPKESAK